jgi:hypothetical protein
MNSQFDHHVIFDVGVWIDQRRPCATNTRAPLRSETSLRKEGSLKLKLIVGRFSLELQLKQAVVFALLLLWC